ncbi:TetR/AcrR family transcriptional regulator [Mycolicibacterium setense]|uniref:TetR/AcrR family transcriptional regulator n=1 Tax=Mycolicibacterium setense TaxID=431269 RepID=UPI0003A91213|nr:TetR/AcrR family transcriptional regulator [Mycolicibacterium setense]MCV7112748.1 TetR/AcrR family transcriptional regulator [Mycolicibacterium setense]
MARQVNSSEHAARRREILAAALRLMHDKGYEAMTIDDLLAELQVSKGALYHYFRSKKALLEGVIEQMGESASAHLAGIVDDPDRGALDKLNAYLDASRAWKSDSPTEVATLIRLWHDENNALLRQKMTQGSMRTTAPMLEAIIRQGCAEGVFDTDYPHEAAGIITGMGLHLADAFIDAIEADGAVGSDISGPHAQKVVGAYLQAFERILGAPPDSLRSTQGES